MRKLLLLLFVIFLRFEPSIAQVYGCTDILATNYNSVATRNDGSCLYANISIAPVKSTLISDTLIESSGLIIYGNRLFTHNDNTDLNLYALDSVTGKIYNKYEVKGASNIDWEDLTQDAEYFYIGDFGNNSSGNRRDLKIYKVSKVSLLSRNPLVQTITFAYQPQIDFSVQAANQTNFDCEAMVAGKDSLYLFSKEWISNITRVYSLPKTAGNYTLKPASSYDVKGLITGAALLEDKRVLMLCGYSSLLQPFLYLMYDFEPGNFFSGNKRKVQLDLSFHQIEGIASVNGRQAFISNENFAKQPLANNPQKIHVLNLSSLLANYLDNPPTAIQKFDTKQKTIDVFPVPNDGFFNFKGFEGALELYSLAGVLLKRFEPSEGLRKIDCSDLPSGIYFLKGKDMESIKLKIEKP
jgi:hypothetical protein